MIRIQVTNPINMRNISYISLIILSLSFSITVNAQSDTVYVPTEYSFIKSNPSHYEERIGHVTTTDTIREISFKGKWAKVKINNIEGWVLKDDLKMVILDENGQQSKLELWLDKYANWKRWYFWAIALGLVIGLVLVLILVGHVSGKLGIDKKLSKYNFVAFVPMGAGVLYGILYLLWPVEMIDFVIHRLSLAPPEFGSMEWFVWGGLALSVLVFIIEVIISTFRMSIIQNIVKILIDLITIALMFITVIYVSIALSIIGIAIMGIWTLSIVLFTSSKQLPKEESNKPKVKAISMAEESQKAQQKFYDELRDKERYGF